jgi:hypothetical protein
MKTYLVTIKSQVIKSIKVEAPSSEEAEIVAHELFHHHPENPEKYSQETININTL